MKQIAKTAGSLLDYTLWAWRVAALGCLVWIGWELDAVNSSVLSGGHTTEYLLHDVAGQVANMQTDVAGLKKDVAGIQDDTRQIEHRTRR